MTHPFASPRISSPRIRTGLALSLGAFLALSVGTAGAVSLNPDAMVSSDRIRLGDLFTDLGAQGKREIGPAPAPGRSVVYDAGYLTRLAHSYQVDWQPAPGESQVVITRATRTIGATEIRAALTEAMTRRVSSGRLQIELDDRGAPIQLPAEARVDVTVENLYFPPAQTRFSAELVLSNESGVFRRVPVAGRALTFIEVPVLSRRVSPGDVITPADITWIEAPTSQLASDVAISEGDLVNRTPRRSLGVQTPVSLRDIQAQRLITKGALVTMVLQAPNMLLTTQGRAMQDGARGEMIRVVNTQSNRTVDAVVVNYNQVSVPRPGGMIN